MAEIATPTFEAYSGGEYVGGGSGSGSAGSDGGSGDSHKTTNTTAQQLVNQPSDVSASTGTTLAEQIAANFAALQAISGGSDVTGSGGPYAVPVPVPVQQSSSKTWIFLLIGAGIIAYFLLRKKRD